MSKYKKPIEKVKSLLQQNHLFNETDLYEDDDPAMKRIPRQKTQSPQSSPIIHTLLSKLQYQTFNDSHLSQNILTNVKNSSTLIFDDSPPAVDSPQTNALTETSIKSTSIQSSLFFGLSFFAHCKAFETFSAHPIHF